MTWSDFYFICFLIGFLLSALSFLAGSVHLHLPHLHIHHGIHMGHAGTPGGMGGRLGRMGRSSLSFFNFATMAAFLAWFGGTGYVLTHYYAVWFLITLGIATVSGLGGASVVFWFLVKVLMKRDIPLDPADYDMIGVLGKLSISIRKGGTGELIYSQEGTRRCTGARSEDGSAIPKGAEVMVTRYEKGIAYVRPWEDPTNELEPRR
jgi:membrane protein implicated in regulation of membrane protease activity